MSTRLREQAARWAEWTIVSLLVASALYEIWVSQGEGWPGSPVVSSVLAAIILPVLFRRRFPLAVLVVVLTASGVQYACAGDAFQPWFAFVLAFYAVAAHSAWRRPARLPQMDFLCCCLGTACCCEVRRIRLLRVWVHKLMGGPHPRF